MSQRDQLHRFLFDAFNIRGEFVQLEATWQAALARSDYPEPVRELLGQAMAAGALLTATIKFEGRLTLQAQGDGPVSMLAVQVGSDGTLRGLARHADTVAPGTLAELIGQGRLVITVEPDKGERYQGVVPLEGEDLGEALRHYFDNSEQLPTHLWLSADHEVAAGLLIQDLPGESEDADAWNRLVQLADTIRPEELRELDVRTLLRRLFHEEDVRLFEPEAVSFRCSCSREKTETMLAQLGEAEVRSVIEDQGEVAVTCEFCGAAHRFDSVDVEALFAGGPRTPGSGRLQ